MLISPFRPDGRYMAAAPLLPAAVPTDLPQGKYAAPHSVPVNVFGRELHVAFYHSRFVSLEELESCQGKLEPGEAAKIERHIGRAYSRVRLSKPRNILKFYLEE